MRKMKFAFLLSIVFVLISNLVNAQGGDPVPVPPFTVTRVDAGTSAGGIVAIGMTKTLGSWTMNLGTQSFADGSSGTFAGMYSNHKFRATVNGVTSGYVPLPTGYTNAESIVFNFGTYSIIVAMYRTSATTWEFSASRSVPVE